MHDSLLLPPSIRTLSFSECQFDVTPSPPPQPLPPSSPRLGVGRQCTRQWLRSATVTSLAMSHSKINLAPCLLSDLSERFPALTELHLGHDITKHDVATSLNLHNTPSILHIPLSKLSDLRTLTFTHDELCKSTFSRGGPIGSLDLHYYMELAHALPRLRKLQLHTLPHQKYFCDRKQQHTRAWDAAQRHVQNFLDNRTRTETLLTVAK
jgi:hypothetical protein